MARKSTKATQLTDDIPLSAEVVAAPQALAAITEAVSEERDMINQLLGQAQMAGAFEEFSRTVRTSKLAFVKENKLYRAIAGRKSPHGAELSGTWEEFCNLLGQSVDQADRDIANLRAFGEAALESMSRMGIGYRELRQYRRLPDDERQALITVAESGDSAAFVDLAETLIDKHEKEKAALLERADEAEADYEAQSQLLAKRAEELETTRKELGRAKRRIKTLSADDATRELRQEVAGIAFEAETDIAGKLREAFATLSAHSDETGIDHRAFQTALVRQLENLLTSIRGEFQLSDDDSPDDFPWLDKSASDDTDA